ncbi:MAG: hypothetical protein ACYSWX_01750 [Planctomycetota bacterium]
MTRDAAGLAQHELAQRGLAQHDLTVPLSPSLTGLVGWASESGCESPTRCV